MQKMSQKNLAITIAVIGIIAVSGVAYLATNTEVFQGKFQFKTFPSAITQIQYYKDKINPSKIVSPVASPVTSVVVSGVTSPGGTSTVASAVTSAVASKVQADPKVTASLNVSQLPTISAKILEDAAKKDLKANPRKYQLSNKEKNRIIELYVTR